MGFRGSVVIHQAQREWRAFTLDEVEGDGEERLRERKGEVGEKKKREEKL